MNEIAHLIAVADAYLRVTGTREVTLSFWVFNDSKKLASLRSGADMTVGRFNAAFVWFSEHWPAGVEWPAGIFRPEPAREAAE